MNRTEPALLGRRWCAGDGAPKARCTLAASAQCLNHESRRRVNMDLCEDGRCARHATFNISAAGMYSMRMLIMQVSTCIRSLAALVLRYAFGTARRAVLRYAFGTARRAGQHCTDVDHAICLMRCQRLDVILVYSSYSGAWQQRSARCAQV